jgi:hypothetical protein
MVSTSIESHIHYRHSPEETAELERAVIPMAEHVKAVVSPQFRSRIRHILKGEYFRFHEARSMRDALLRAVKQARMSLGDYFPGMRAQILVNALALEEAVQSYWIMLQNARDESAVTL